MSASGLPITQLGSTIKAHLDRADKYLGKSEEHFKAAGIHLVEAKARIASGEYEGAFGAFLIHECNDLSSSRAYELIAIASGETTIDQMRAAGAARVRKHRAACKQSEAHAAKAAPRTTSSPLRNGHRPVSLHLAERAALLEQYVEAGRAMSSDQLRAALVFISTLQLEPS